MTEAYILHIDTATQVCSVCISKGERLLYQTAVVSGKKASERIHMLIAEVLEASDLELNKLSAVSVSSGPGSYTGLRIGFSAAKGLCFATGLPMISVPTPLQLAYQAAETRRADYYIAMIDARRDEVYAAIYDQHFNQVVPETAVVLTEQEYINWNRQFPHSIYCGDGAKKWHNILPDIGSTYSSQIVSDDHEARFMILPAMRKFSLKAFEDLKISVPAYLKLPNITPSKKSLFN
jgi:tRNA threonylcarbamoyladenosine biosynthesis protein TsaB